MPVSRRNCTCPFSTSSPASRKQPSSPAATWDASASLHSTVPLHSHLHGVCIVCGFLTTIYPSVPHKEKQRRWDGDHWPLRSGKARSCFYFDVAARGCS